MNKKILLIEDNEDMRENTVEILQLANFNVVTAKNGREGVELAQEENPDLIICDIMMPLLDGYGVLQMLGKNESTVNIPFIFLTAKAERSDLRKGMDMGADDYLTKPFDDVELLNAIESRFRKVELMKKEFAKNIEGLNEFISNARGLEDLKRLSDQRDLRPYKKKTYIYSEDHYPKGVYFISKGKIKTYKRHEEGKELITGLYKEGDFFGYQALIEDAPYTDNAMAMEESEVCLIPKEDFHSLVYKNAEVSRKFIKMLSADLKEREEQLIKLAYNSVRKRIAEALVTISNKYMKDGANSMSIQISREDLANIVGTATETTIRSLSDFKDEGLVDIKQSTITIINYEKLAAMRN